MTTAADQNLDAIPESRAARWAWRVSLIPLLGVPLFILLAFIALYRIGGKGRTGFWLLRRGVVALPIINLLVYVAFYHLGFSGCYPGVYDNLYWFLPKHGWYSTYFENGKLKEQSTWNYGVLHGTFTLWTETGKIEESGKYDFGQKHGKWNYGTIPPCVREYNRGLRHGYWVYRQFCGEPAAKGPYVNDMKHGRWIYYDSQHYRSAEGNYFNDLKDGYWAEWYYNKRLSEGNYKLGQKVGKWQYWEKFEATLEKVEWYDSSGCLKRSISYELGEPFETTDYVDDKPVRTADYKEGDYIQDK